MSLLLNGPLDAEAYDPTTLGFPGRSAVAEHTPACPTRRSRSGRGGHLLDPRLRFDAVDAAIGDAGTSDAIRLPMQLRFMICRG